MPTDADRAANARWRKLEPIKIGLMGGEWTSFEREVRMAFDEGVEALKAIPTNAFKDYEGTLCHVAANLYCN